jgi:hypothetical protein
MPAQTWARSPHHSLSLDYHHLRLAGSLHRLRAIGFIWLFFWIWLYEIPAKHKRLSKPELVFINSDPSESMERSTG